MGRRKLQTERQPHVFHVSAGRVDQHDGGLGAWAARRKPELGHVQPHASTRMKCPAGGCAASMRETPIVLIATSTPSQRQTK